MSNSAPVQRLRVLDLGYFQIREDTIKKIVISGLYVDSVRNELLLSDLYNKRIKRAALNREPFSVQNIYTSTSNQFAGGVTRLKVGKEDGSDIIGGIASLELTVTNDQKDGPIFAYELVIVAEHPDNTYEARQSIPLPEILERDGSLEAVERHHHNIVQVRDGSLLVLVTHRARVPGPRRSRIHSRPAPAYFSAPPQLAHAPPPSSKPAASVTAPTKPGAATKGGLAKTQETRATQGQSNKSGGPAANTGSQSKADARAARVGAAARWEPDPNKATFPPAKPYPPTGGKLPLNSPTKSGSPAKTTPKPPPKQGQMQVEEVTITTPRESSASARPPSASQAPPTARLIENEAIEGGDIGEEQTQLEASDIEEEEEELEEELTEIWEVARQMHTQLAFAGSVTRRKRSARIDGEALCMSYDPQANLLALSMTDKTIRIVDRMSLKEVRRITRESAFVPHCVLFVPTFKLLLITNASSSTAWGDLSNPSNQQEEAKDESQKNSESSTESRVFSLEAFNLEGNNLFRGGDLFGGKLDDASAGVQFSALTMQSEDQLIAFDSSRSTLSVYLVNMRRIVHLGK